MQDIDFETNAVDVKIERENARVDPGIDMRVIGGWPVVCGVVPASPADAAGMLVGDVILSVNGKSSRNGVFTAAVLDTATLRLGVKQVTTRELDLAIAMMESGDTVV
jgi:S1-C subfamily serine protease